jgi:hypothetical protein
MADEYKAVVQKTLPHGKHGPYAVAESEELGFILITFSLTPPVWNEDAWPEGGSIVVLSRVTKKRAGWRASTARFFKPADEKLQNQNQHQNQD